MFVPQNVTKFELGIDLKEWQIKGSELLIEKEIGRGAHG